MSDKSFEQALAEKFRASEQEIDEDTVRQLAEIRHQLLQGSAEEPPAKNNGYRQWGGWLAAATVAAVAVLLTMTVSEAPLQDADEIVFTEDSPVDMELLENLEFYEWLAAQEDLG